LYKLCSQTFGIMITHLRKYRKPENRNGLTHHGCCGCPAWQSCRGCCPAWQTVVCCI